VSIAPKKKVKNPCLSGSTTPLGTGRYALLVRLHPTGYAWQATRSVSARARKMWPRLYQILSRLLLTSAKRHAGGRGEVTVNRDEPVDLIGSDHDHTMT